MTDETPEYTPYSETAHTNVGPGWQSLIVRLEEALTVLGVGYTLVQLKEKMGGLRYYVTVHEGTDEITNWATHALIGATEEESTRVCEECGARGTNRSVLGWWKTLCDDHFVQRYTERKAERARWAAQDAERKAASAAEVTP